MKQLFFIFISAIVLSGFVWGSWLNDYEDALQKAQTENKLVLMIYVKKG